MPERISVGALEGLAAALAGDGEGERTGADGAWTGGTDAGEMSSETAAALLELADWKGEAAGFENGEAGLAALRSALGTRGGVAAAL